jgi:hypothetical protein
MSVEARFIVFPGEVRAALVLKGETKPECRICGLGGKRGLRKRGIKGGCDGAQRGYKGLYYTTYELTKGIATGKTAEEARAELLKLIAGKARCAEGKHLKETTMNARDLERSCLVLV